MALPSSLADRFVPGAAGFKRSRVLRSYDRAMTSLRSHDYDVSTDNTGETDDGFKAAAEATLAARFGLTV